jgi:hypothetical protein
MKLTNEEYQTVFALYYHAECITTEFPQKGKVKHIGSIPTDANYYKLLLTPLEKISDEHAVEVADFVFTKSVKENERLRIGKNFIDYTYLDRGLSHYDSEELNEFDTNHNRMIFQYLISKGYAVPLWFGIDHWANGKTAIQLGIATSTQSNNI